MVVEEEEIEEEDEEGEPDREDKEEDEEEEEILEEIEEEQEEENEMSEERYFFFFNSLPNSRIFDWSKLKGFADNKSNMAQVIAILFDRVENIVGKEKMLVTSIFSFSHNVFKKLLPQGR